jgi:hypothetical protein
MHARRPRLALAFAKRPPLFKNLALQLEPLVVAAQTLPLASKGASQFRSR